MEGLVDHNSLVLGVCDKWLHWQVNTILKGHHAEEEHHQHPTVTYTGRSSVTLKPPLQSWLAYPHIIDNGIMPEYTITENTMWQTYQEKYLQFSGFIFNEK